MSIFNDEFSRRIKEFLGPLLVGLPFGILTVLSMFGIGYTDDLGKWTWWYWVILVVVVISVAIGYVLAWKSTQTDPKLQEQLGMATATEKEREYLAGCIGREFEDIAKQFWKIFGRNIHVRVSIYAKYPQRDCMAPIARWAENTNLCVVKKDEYQLDRGYIRQIWEDGIGYCEFTNPRKDYAKQGLTQEDIDNLTMLSTSMAGVKLQDDGDPIGVVIVESNAKLEDFTLKSLIDTAGAEPSLLALSASLVKGVRKYLEDMNIASGKIPRGKLAVRSEYSKVDHIGQSEK